MDSRQGSHEGSHVAGPGESQAKLAWARTGLREPGAAQVAEKSRSSGRGSWDGEDRGVRGYSLVAGGGGSGSALPGSCAFYALGSAPCTVPQWARAAHGPPVKLGHLRFPFPALPGWEPPHRSALGLGEAEGDKGERRRKGCELAFRAQPAAWGGAVVLPV